MEEIQERIAEARLRETGKGFEKNEMPALEKLRKQRATLNFELGDAGFLKRKKLTKEIAKIEEDIAKEELKETETKKLALEKREKEEAIEKDRKEKPLLYFVAERNKNLYIPEFARGSSADLRKVPLDRYYREYENLVKTAENEGYFLFNIYGFVMIIKNVKEISDEKGIRLYSDQAIYKVVGPKGEIVADDIKGYNQAREVYESATSEYQAKIEKELEVLKK